MLPIPTKFFVTSGKAVSKVSDLNAFDEALQNAGLAEQNIVSVSSVLPVGIKPVRLRTGANYLTSPSLLKISATIWGWGSPAARRRS